MTMLQLLHPLLFAAEVLAASILLPFAAWVICLFLRERAALRHLVRLAMFGVLLMLPLLAVLVPPQRVLEYATPGPATAAYDVPPPVFDASAWTVSDLMMALLIVWLAGVCWNLLRLAAGAFAMHRLRRNSIAFDDVVEDCEVRLASSPPLVFGWLRPVIVLPLNAPSWPQERLDAVLEHERAHVRRLDNLSHAVALMTCAVYWPNPFLWLARDAMRRDAEIAADDLVLASGVRPSVYAAELLAIAAEYRGRAPLAALAMASPSSLETRVTSILSPTAPRKGVTAMDVFRVSCLGSAAALTLVFARPGIAEAQSPAPPAPAMPEAAPLMPEAPMPPEPPPAPPPPPRPTAMTSPPAPPAPWGLAIPRDHPVLPDAERAKLRTEMARAEVRRAQADLERAKADVKRAQARAAQAQAEAARSEAELSRRDFGK